MKIYLACPVRNITDNYKSLIDQQVEFLEKKGHLVYYPARDTNQGMNSFDICAANKKAILESDKVYVIWDGKSQGVLFDMGIAFALHKDIKTLIGYMPKMTREKSFQNLFYEWEVLSLYSKEIYQLDMGEAVYYERTHEE